MHAHAVSGSEEAAADIWRKFHHKHADKNGRKMRSAIFLFEKCIILTAKM
jgi:hypothetical protein